jgi:hypothetical protein
MILFLLNEFNSISFNRISKSLGKYYMSQMVSFGHFSLNMRSEKSMNSSSRTLNRFSSSSVGRYRRRSLNKIRLGYFN